MLEKAWLGNVDLSEDNVHYAPRPDSGWVMYKEKVYDGEQLVDEIIWLYYVNGPVRGTYNPDDPSNPLGGVRGR
ncbi:MAG: hypothetical protein QM368_01905 [Bacillota bacterium]|nr:hypothetical protein [Bacillota bacterium]